MMITVTEIMKERDKFPERRNNIIKQFYIELETERILSDVINNPKKYLDIVKKEMEITKLDNLNEESK